MVNYILLKSSAVCSVAQITTIFYLQPLQIKYTIFLLGGCTTSLLNHGTTHKYIQLLDRLYMLLGAVVITYIAQTTTLKVAPWIATLLYLLGKCQNNIQYYHIIAHIVITITNICICFELKN